MRQRECRSAGPGPFHPEADDARFVITMARKPRRKRADYACTLCEQNPPFCFVCPDCGFQICTSCMMENEWGMSCNKVTWECPDCGRVNML